jgi:hypothetical protein
MGVITPLAITAAFLAPDRGADKEPARIVTPASPGVKAEANPGK